MEWDVGGDQGLGAAEQIEVDKAAVSGIERVGAPQLLDQPIGEAALLAGDLDRTGAFLASHLPAEEAIQLGLHRSRERGERPGHQQRQQLGQGHFGAMVLLGILAAGTRQPGMDCLCIRTGPMRAVTKLFLSNRSQAVRIPAHLRLPDSVTEVEVRACGQERSEH